MEPLELADDFKDFLKLLNSTGVEYLLIGGYAVAYHGYPRATGDLDIWIAMHPENAGRIAEALQAFGFTEGVSPDLFLRPGKMTRMGMPPVRIELLTVVSGVEFDAAYARRVKTEIEGVPVDVISLEDLKANKRASGNASTPVRPTARPH